MSFIRGYYRLSLSCLLLVFFSVLVVIASLLPLPVRKIPLPMRLAQWMVRAILWVLNVRVNCPEAEKLREFDGFFFPNHVSYLEILGIYSVAPTRFLAKAEVRELPAIGNIAAAIGCVFVQRGDKQSRQAARQALTEVSSFPPITLFPEGKRGPGDVLLPFRYGAFEIVSQGSFAFLPIAVSFSHLEIAIWHRHENIVKALWRLSSQPEQITINLTPQAPQRPTPADDPVALAEKTQAQLTAVLYPDLLQQAAQTG